MAMVNGISGISTLEDLRAFVEKTICDRNQLLVGAFKFHEQVVVRSGKPCGLHLTLCGPRAVEFSAIWDAHCHTILFYDCNGHRFQSSDLPHSAGLQRELAALASDEREDGILTRKTENE